MVFHRICTTQFLISPAQRGNPQGVAVSARDKPARHLPATLSLARRAGRELRRGGRALALRGCYTSIAVSACPTKLLHIHHGFGKGEALALQGCVQCAPFGGCRTSIVGQPLVGCRFGLPYGVVDVAESGSGGWNLRKRKENPIDPANPVR